VTVITGGAGGMGTATAAIVGRDHAVVLADVRAERLDAAVAALKDRGISATGGPPMSPTPTPSARSSTPPAGWASWFR